MRSDDSGRIFYSRGLIFSQFGLPHIVGYNRRMVDALLTTKLYIPHIRPDLVSRPGLLVRLTEGLSRPLILISAPAGYGKTTLLSKWIAANRLRVAWLSLDEQDNNALRFWMYVIAAFRTVTDEAFGQNASEMFEASPPSSIQMILNSLLNDIATLSAEVILILDDYHIISNPAIHEGIAFIVEHQPTQLHLVIATRADPPVPVLAKNSIRAKICTKSYQAYNLLVDGNSLPRGSTHVQPILPSCLRAQIFPAPYSTHPSFNSARHTH